MENIGSPRTGLSFRLLVPLSEERRKIRYMERSEAGWLKSRLTSNASFYLGQGKLRSWRCFAIRFTLKVALTERQAVFLLWLRISPTISSAFIALIWVISSTRLEAWLRLFIQLCLLVEWSLWPLTKTCALSPWVSCTIPPRYAAAVHRWRHHLVTQPKPGVVCRGEPGYG
jgi:hypothetical protein